MKWHRTLTALFLITLILHLIELPALKEENSAAIRGGESYSQTHHEQIDFSENEAITKTI